MQWTGYTLLFIKGFKFCLDPVYQYLRTQSILHDTAAKKTKGITWNFSKFLLNKDGKVVKYYVPEIAAIKIKPDIQELLKQ